jgi:hypothetical protein
MNKISILSILFLFSHFALAQNHLEYTLKLEFEGNIVTEVDGKFTNLSNDWKLEKFEKSCKFENIEYIFQQKDTLLLRYFKEIKETCSRKEIEYFYGTLGQIWFDGTIIRGWFKSDSIDRSFGYGSGDGAGNPLQFKVFDNFFNIALYLLSQPSSTEKLSKLQLAALRICEKHSNNVPVQIISFNPLTYRLNDRVDETSYEKVINLFNNLPINKPAYFEAGILFNISQTDRFYTFIKEFLKSPNNIIWIPDNENVFYRLRALGVKKKNILKISKK